MSRKRFLKLLAILLFGGIFLAAGIAVSFAWFSKAAKIDATNLSGQLFTGYFYSGSGTEDDPYVITRPVHYINMTRLIQYDEAFANKSYKLGYDFNNTGELEVFNYDDNGKLISGTSTTLNMAGYPVLPIGDSTHPFTGKFDGSNIVVDNLTVAASNTTDLGVFGYVSSDASIHDAYFNNLSLNLSSIDSVHSDETVGHCGYLAGHLEAAESFENSYVNNCTIFGSSNGVTVKNDWGYFGCCDNAASLDAFIMRARGDDVGFGGSVDMKAAYNRIETLQNRSSIKYIPKNIYYNNIYQYTEQNAFPIEYFYDENIGEVVWYPYDQNDFSGNFNYLAGGISSVDINYKTVQKTGYKIYSNNTYFNNNNTTLTATTNRESATVWTLSKAPANNVKTTISTTINNRNYYIRYNATVSLSTTSYEWTYEVNGTGYRLKNGNRYLRYYNGWTTTTTVRNATVFNFDYDTFNVILDDGTISYNYDYSNAMVTYLPLLTNEDNTTSLKNTGYIISGSSYINPSYEFPIKSGDIRISKYSATGSITSQNNNLRNSYNGNTKQLTSVYTIAPDGQRKTVVGSNYKRYTAAEEDLLKSISSGNVYGLHFMDGLINKDNLITVPKATINNKEYSNYQLPTDSIDFNLAESGYITFFAGTYFSGNNSFFSLHNIIRDENNNIEQILEIVEIYGSTNKRLPYIYKYSDNTYSAELDATYELIFKTSQIKLQNSLVQNAIYYFEIPVNMGEYALGSVENGTGAYLIYLDIGTNGGENIKSLVDDFKSVEYRPNPLTTLSSICLITYEQENGTTLNISTYYNDTDKTYYITCTSDTKMEILITLLDLNYKINFNGQLINKIETKKFIV